MTHQLKTFLLRFQFWLAYKDFSHAYRHDLLTGNRGRGPRAFLHLNRHATEICMPCKHIWNFRDHLTRAARSLGSNEKSIPNMPRVPKSPVCRAGQIFWYAGHTKVSLWHAVNAQVSSLNLQLF